MRWKEVILMAILVAAGAVQAEPSQAEREAALKKLLEGHKQPENPWLKSAHELAQKDPRMAAWASWKCRQAQYKLDHETPTPEALDRLYEYCWIKQ